MISNLYFKSFSTRFNLLCTLLFVSCTIDLTSCKNQTAADQHTIHLLAISDSREYLIGERVSISVFTDHPIQYSFLIEAHFDPPNQLLNCSLPIYCLPQVLTPHRPMLRFIWQSVDAGGLTVYFTAKVLFQSSVSSDPTSNSSSSHQIHLDTSLAFVPITIGKAHWLFAMSQLCGWTYFLLWILSMYPQMIFNQRRQSVVGLNFDYLAFSLIGYAAYALFNCSLYFVPYFRDAYLAQYPHSHVPVQLNDVFFSVHGTLASLVIVLQCIFFERGNQRVSFVGITVTCAVFLISGSLFIALSYDLVHPLQFAYFFSYVKVCLTVAKYVPQVIFNYQRQSCHGWCIHNILLDINGGCLSILQMLLLAINYQDVKFLSNNLAKFCIGAVSVAFDLIFLTQHYCLYGDQEPMLLDSLMEDELEQPIKSDEFKDRLLACGSIDRTKHYGTTASTIPSIQSKNLNCKINRV